MLFNRRKRLEELARQEAEGATFWTPNFDTATRNRLIYAFLDAAGNETQDAARYARAAILRDEGWVQLTSGNKTGYADFLEYTAGCDDDMMPTVVEAMLVGLGSLPYNPIYDVNPQRAQHAFVTTARTVLREHRIAFDLVGGQMVPMDSQELHVEVVKPTLTLLASTQGLAKVEKAYRDALEELANGKPDDAITDAGTALQEMLVALGATGNALGPLIKSAKTKGLLAPHDTTLSDAIEKAMHWASADRSETGDAHSSSDAIRQDAWLMVHIVGALIVRLAGGPKRRPI